MHLVPESYSSLLGIKNKPMPFFCISWCKSNDVYLDRANKNMRPQTRCWRKETIFFCKATLLPATVRRFYREVPVLWCRSDTTEPLCKVHCWLPSLPYAWWLGACSVYTLFWCVFCLAGGKIGLSSDWRKMWVCLPAFLSHDICVSCCSMRG